MSEFLAAARSYADRGWRVFPLAERSKDPKISKKDGGRGFHDAVTDAAQIEAWWKRWPNANVGITCCEQSGFFILDIDPKHNGDQSLRDLVEANGALPATTAAKTGSGGFHFYFKYVPGIGSSTGRIAAGIDTRGDDTGYVVAPPSIHPNGGSYRWARDRGPELAPLEVAPLWLLEAYRLNRGRGGNSGEGRAGAGAAYWRELFANGAGDGERNDAIIRLTGYLVRRKLDPFLVLDIMRLWNEHRLSPPGDPEKLEDIVNRVCERELGRVTKGRT